MSFEYKKEIYFLDFIALQYLQQPDVKNIVAC